jgi:hypothetical protein
MPAILAFADILDKAAELLADPTITSDQLCNRGLPGQSGAENKLLTRTRNQVAKRFGLSDDLRADVEIFLAELSRPLPAPELLEWQRKDRASQFREQAEVLREFVAARLKKAKELRRLRKARNAVSSDEQKRTTDEQGGPWSKPDSPSRWAKVFKMSTRTFIRHVEKGVIHAKRLSDKSYQVALSDIPKPQASPPR